MTAARATRLAVMGGALLVVISLSRIGGARGEVSTGSVVFGVVIGLLLGLGILATSRMCETTLTVTADEVVLRTPRVLRSGSVVRRRSRSAIDAYRGRISYVELLPWPPPGDVRGAASRAQRVVVSGQVLPLADVQRAYELHGIPSA
jgi:hypothetical protein